MSEIATVGGYDYEPGHAPAVVKQQAWAWGSCPCGWRTDRVDRDSMHVVAAVAAHGRRSAVLMITEETP